MDKKLAQRTQFGPPCSYDGCKGFAMAGRDACRWHVPEVLELRKVAEEARQAALRAARAL